MNIWILQTGEPLHIDEGNPRPMRAMNLANALIAKGHHVVLWSSAFYHQEKRHRCRVAETIHVSPQLEIHLIPSPGYQRNIGIGRLWDHAMLAVNLKRWLQQEKTQPDVAFIGYPPIEAAAVMTRWLTIRGVPTLLDVKDQWPGIFVEALPQSLQPIGRIVFSPYFYLAKRTMRDATGIASMADSFLQWATNFAEKSRTAMDKVIPLTTANDQINDVEIEAAREWWDNQGIVENGQPRIIFVGSHSQSFDFNTVFEAAKTFAIADNNCEFVICGTGENFVTNKEITKEIKNIFFPGWISRPHLLALTERSIASIAPYNNTKDFVMSIPNKVIDSLSLGLPIITPLRGEVDNLISEYDVGLQYCQNSSKSLVECIEKIINNSSLQQKMANNALKLYQQKFSYDIVYGSLIDHLEMLSHQKRNNTQHMNQDKLVELSRYDERAQLQLSRPLSSTPVHNIIGSVTMPHYLRAPYAFYERCIAELIKSDYKVLELGAGTGLHTWALIETKATITATDISPNALKLIGNRASNIITRVADIEALPFENNSFDVLTCAGSLSYGDPLLVDAEIKRVLKPGGFFICVDSLNHNPIYRFNRWIHYLRGHRTKSTLQRMPNLQRIDALSKGFKQTEVRYFGSSSFVMPIIARLFGSQKAAYLSDSIDSALSTQCSAFKFVLVAQDFQK